MWRRVWDSNPRAQRANGFQDRLVMTTSITLRRVSLAKCSGNWREFRERTMKFLYDGKCRKPLIWQGFWGNKRNSYARVFKTASLWPLRGSSAKPIYPSVYELPSGRYHRIFHFLRNNLLQLQQDALYHNKSGIAIVKWKKYKFFQVTIDNAYGLW